MTVTERVLRYQEDSGVNQSLLKKVISVDDPEPEKLPGRKKYMEIGDVVDAILTFPQEAYTDKFLIVDSETRPGDTMDKIITFVYNNRGQETDLEILTPLIEKAVEITEYKGNAHWTTDQRVEKVIKETSAYWNHLMAAEGRTIVLTKDWQNCQQIANNLKTATNTVAYHRENGFTITAEYQLDLYGNLSEVRCKGLLDKVLFDDVNRTIQPIDYKVTGGSLRDWKYTARKFRYDIQSSFYTALLRINYPDWEILPFAFLVANHNPAVQPYVYTASPFDLHIGEFGARRFKSMLLNEDDIIITKEEDIIYGWRDALEIYKDCVRLGVEDFDLDSFFNNRIKVLDVWS